MPSCLCTAGNDEIKILRVVPHHVERDDGVLWSLPTFRTASRDDQSRADGDIEFAANRLTVTCVDLVGRGRGNQSQLFCRNAESPVTFAVGARAGDHAIRSAHLPSRQPPAEPAPGGGGIRDNQARTVDELLSRETTVRAALAADGPQA